MSDVKISELTEATAIDLDDLMPVVEDGTTVKATFAQIFALACATSLAWTSPQTHEAALATTPTLAHQVTGDTQARHLVDAAGRHLWGSGSAAQDADLYRLSAGMLGTSGGFSVGGVLGVTGLLTASNGLTLSGGTLTLPAASIADAALGANVALINAAKTWSAAQTFNAGITGTTAGFSGAASANSLSLTTPLPVASGGTGAATLAGAGIITTAGGQTIAGAHTITGNATVGGTLGVTGLLTASGNVLIGPAARMTGYYSRASSHTLVSTATGSVEWAGLVASIVANPAANSTGRFTGLAATSETETGVAYDVTTLRALSAKVHHRGTGTLGNAIGVDVPTIERHGSAIITTLYGLKIDSQTAGATNWAVYTSGTTRSYFGGPVLFGYQSDQGMSLQSTATGATSIGHRAWVTGDPNSANGATAQSTLASIMQLYSAGMSVFANPSGLTPGATFTPTKIADVTGNSTWFVGAPTVYSSYSLGSRKTYTDTTGTRASVVGESVGNPGSTSTAAYVGTAGFAEGSGSQNITTVLGLQGVRGEARYTGTGTVTGLTAFFAKAPSNTGGGTVTSAFAIYLESPTVGTSNNWALYSPGSAPSSFGGLVRTAGWRSNHYSDTPLFVSSALNMSFKDYTSTSGDQAGTWQYITNNPATVSSSGTTYGNYSRVGMLGSNNGARSATAGFNQVVVSGPSASARGTRDEVYVEAAGSGVFQGNLTRVSLAASGAQSSETRVSYSELDVVSGATATLATLYHGGVTAGTGAIGTLYGLRLPYAADRATTATWGVYVDNAKSYFGGGADLDGPARFWPRTKAQLAAIPHEAGSTVYCTDFTGGARLVTSDGTTWRDGVGTAA